MMGTIIETGSLYNIFFNFPNYEWTTWVFIEKGNERFFLNLISSTLSRPALSACSFSGPSLSCRPSRRRAGWLTQPWFPLVVVVNSLHPIWLFFFLRGILYDCLWGKHAEVEALSCPIGSPCQSCVFDLPWWRIPPVMVCISPPNNLQV